MILLLCRCKNEDDDYDSSGKILNVSCWLQRGRHHILVTTF